MKKLIRDVAVRENGATAIEYNMIAGMIALLLIVTVTSIGSDLLGLLQSVAAAF